jgi:hypothetical protein
MSLPLSVSELNILYSQLKPGGLIFDGLNVKSNIYFPTNQWSTDKYLNSTELNMYKVKLESNVYISDSLVSRNKLVVGNTLSWSNRLMLNDGISSDSNSIVPTDRSFNALIDGNLFVSNDIMCSSIIKKKKDIIVNNADFTSNIYLNTNKNSGKIILNNVTGTYSNILILQNTNIKSQFNNKGYNKQCTQTCCSADGLFIVVINNPGYIDISVDEGISWKQTGFYNNWTYCSCSRSLLGDNYYIAVSDTIGNLYTSFNNGDLWIKQSILGKKQWSSLSFSNNADHLFATVTNEYLYVGKFIDTTNILKTDAPSLNWSNAKSSIDGKYIISSEQNGNIWFSNNYGIVFEKKIDYDSYDWNYINISSNGQNVIATEYGGNLWLSNNYGNSFDKINITNKNWDFVNQSIDGNIIITGTIDDKVWVSNNSGNTFNEISNSVEIVSSVTKLLLATSQNSKYIIICNSDNKLFYSDNFGITFVNIINDTSGKTFSQIFISEDGIYVYLLSTINTIYIYNTITKLNLSNSPVNFNFIIKKILLSKITNSVYIIPDKGFVIHSDITLTITDRFLTDLGYNLYNLAECSIDGKKIIITTLEGYIMTSNDSGNTWNKNYNKIINNLNSLSIYGDQILLSSNINGNIFNSTSNVFYSIDYNWSSKDYLGKRKWNNILCSNTSGNVLATVDGGKLYSSFDYGENWTHFNMKSISYNNTNLIAIEENGLMYKIKFNTGTKSSWQIINGTLRRNWKDVHYTGSHIVATEYAGNIHISQDNGTTWNVYGNADNKWDSIAYSTGNIYISMKEGNIYKFQNSDNTLTNLNNSPSQNWQDIACSELGDIVVGAVYNGSVYNSVDYGNNWNTLSTKWNSVVCDSSGQNITGIVSNGYIYNSTDGGKFWNTYKTDRFRDWQNISCDISGRVIVTTEKVGNIYVSIDNGLFWNSNTNLGIKNWSGLCCSSNGLNLLAYEKTGNIGNIWFSNTQGTTWNNTQLPNINLYNISCDSDMKNILGIEVNGNILTSNTKGTTWIKRTNNAKSWTSCSVSTDGQYMIACVNNEYLYISSDYGISWTTKLNDALRNWTCVTVNSSGNYMVATSSGTNLTSTTTGYIFISSDYGNNWTYADWQSISCNVEGTNVIAAVKNSYLYRSTDSGQTWNPLQSAGLNNWSVVSHSQQKYDNVNYIICAAIYNGFIYISYDSGISWNAKNSVRYWINIKLSENGQYIIAAESNGYLYYSKDMGSNWTEITVNGIQKWTGLDISNDGSIIYATVYGDKIYSSIDFGENWTNHNWSQTIISSDALINISIVYGGYLYKSVYQSNNWITTVIKTFNSQQLNKNRYWKCICGVSDLSTMFAVEDNGNIWKSVDYGESWTSLSSIGYENWSSISCQYNPIGSIFVGVTIDNGSIYTSHDSGVTWMNTLFDTSRKWKSISINYNGSIITAVATNDKIYISNDSGNTWQTDYKWRSISTNKTNGNYSLALVENGYLYISNNSGTDWVKGNTQNVNKITRNWRSTYVSDDGSKMSAVVYGGNIWQSFDYGNSWIDNNITQNWTFISGYLNGTNQLAGGYNGNIYKYDTGIWNEISSTQSNGLNGNLSGTLGNKKWIDGCSDMYGNTIYTLIEDGTIYKSTNQYNFSISDLNLTANNWTSIATSGQYVIATNTQNIYTSINYGNTFSLNTSINNRNWKSCDISIDGRYQYFVEDNGYIWSSNNYGSTINVVNGVNLNNKLNYSSISCTNDGKNLFGTILTNNDYQLLKSTNYGSSFTYFLTNGVRNWNNIIVSNVGNIMYTSEYDGMLYKSTSEGAVWNNLSSTTNKWTSISTNNNGNILIAGVMNGSIFEYNNILSIISGTINKEWKSVSLSSNIINGKILFSAVSSGSGDNSLIRLFGNNKLTLVENANKNYTDISCSNIGSNVLVSIKGDKIYQSNDFGGQFNIINTSPNINWQSIEISKNSNQFIGISYGNIIYTSNDYGITYSNNITIGNSKSVAISGDGLSQYVVNINGDLMRKYSGAFITSNVIERREWKTCDISYDGSQIVAMIDNINSQDQIYTANNNTFTFLPKVTDKNRKWTSISSNSAGSMLIACEESGYIYISTNLGLSWKYTHFISNWIKVKFNPTGTVMYALEKNGYIWNSTDMGINWSIFSNLKKTWKSIDAKYTDIIVLSDYYNVEYINAIRSEDGFTYSYDNNQSWKGITISNKGGYALIDIQNIYFNNGLYWTYNTNIINNQSRLFIENYKGIISAEDDSKFIIYTDTNIYICYNKGTNIFTFDNVLKFTSISASSDLLKLVGTIFNDRIYKGIYQPNYSKISWNNINISLKANFKSIVSFVNSISTMTQYAMLISNDMNTIHYLYISENNGNDWIKIGEINSGTLTNLSIVKSDSLFTIYTIDPNGLKLYKYQHYFLNNNKFYNMNQYKIESINLNYNITPVTTLYNLTTTHNSLFFGIFSTSAFIYRFTPSGVGTKITTFNLSSDTSTYLTSIYYNFISSANRILYIASQYCIYYSTSLTAYAFSKAVGVQLQSPENFVSIYATRNNGCVYAATNQGNIYFSTNSRTSSPTWQIFQIYDTTIKKIISNATGNRVIVLTSTNAVYISTSYGSNFKPYLMDNTHDWVDICFNSNETEVLLISNNEYIYYGNADNTYESSVITTTIGGYNNLIRQPNVCVKSILNNEALIELEYEPKTDGSIPNVTINYDIN